MGFRYKSTSIDFGTTMIENIFINDFMPTANGTHVKVYLMGFKFASDNEDNSNVSNATFARNMNLSLEDVLDAWDFWEKKGIIKKYDIDDEDPRNFNVEFLSLRQLYIDNNFSDKNTVQVPIMKVKSTDKLISALENPIINSMFKSIEEKLLRQLTPKECQDILDWIYNFKLDPDLIESAFEYSIDVLKKKRISYVGGIIRKWYDEGIRNVKDLDIHLEQNNREYYNYRSIYKILGYKGNSISAGDKEVMNHWLVTLGLDMDYLTKVITEASKRTSNVNMNYLNKIITNLYEKGVKDLSSFESYQLESKNKPVDSKDTSNVSKRAPNKFHNFEQKITKLSNDDLEKIIKRQSMKRKVKRNLTGE